MSTKQSYNGNWIGDIHAPATTSDHETNSPVESIYARRGKRVFDVVLAILLLPVIAPVLLVLWLLVRRDGGPGFFGHRRIGRNGKVFPCWKVRSMVFDAERKLRDYLAEHPEAADEWSRDHKLSNDPRITPLGNFLRKSSLDELPQIWNVIKGDMSFVGPRPIVREELKKYGPYKRIYVSMAPGITGLWQVSGRNDVSYDERVNMDVEYVSSISLRTDVKIILATANSVVNRTGK
ncbi:sugar transferase [Puniceibacterium sediminis]|uniref:Undecaprenyl-phosphate galactose phosphotransferase, WbaP n=1 Tax=Puniceibacterium sediminis TaxID=1608407 RepID=A0A238WUT9_9RHOB|nr:sugar transferase [Puniceibacterium sediminis]SNR50158.1 Undecaprenyl-phosphate galactose phosphotransferase, WbaP [Puniceibacterium sediminis]